MPTAHIASENLRELDALSALLAREGLVVESVSDVTALFARRDFDGAGCIVLNAPTDDSAVELTSRLREESCEALPVIVLSPRAAVSLAVEAMKRGAADFIEKPVDETRLIRAVREALELSHARAEETRRKRELAARFRTLSARERDVVDAVLGGRGNREVASQLGIKPRTVETHRSNAMSKLGARTLPDLVRIWLNLDAGRTRRSAHLDARFQHSETRCEMTFRGD
ncbi:response regulator transcription factor [Methylocystis sp. S23]